MLVTFAHRTPPRHPHPHPHAPTGTPFAMIPSFSRHQRHLFTLIAATASVFCSTNICPTSAIVIRDDVSDAAYKQDPSQYPHVFSIDSNGNGRVGDCTATLIDSKHAISAAHCFGKKFKQFNVKIVARSYTVVKVHKNPCFSIQRDGPNGADTAVLTLNKPVPASEATPTPVYPDADEVGKRIVIVGWGDTGKAGIKGSQTIEDQTFRVAENKVDKVTKGTVVYTFNSGSDGGLPLEGIAWSGDSGGPAFISKNGVDYIAGVNSAGDCCKYGSRDAYSRLSIKKNWIAATVKAEKAQAWNCKALADYPAPPPSPSPPSPPSVTTKAPVTTTKRAPPPPPPSPSPPPAQMSKAKCSNLAPHFDLRYNNNAVCGSSKQGGGKGKCFGKRASHTAANQKCEIIGARLCTADELQSDVARGSGCSLDARLVWTPTACKRSNGKAGRLAVRGRFGGNSKDTTRCLAAKSRSAGIRCCADVGNDEDDDDDGDDDDDDDRN